jgi:hypothetical protein
MGERSWIVEAHRDGTCFVARVDEQLIALVELEWPIRV